MVPEDWETINLSDVVYYQEGPGLRKWQYRPSGVPFLNIRCIKDGKIVTEALQFVDETEAMSKYRHFLLQAGDFVVSSSGTLGRVATVTEADIPLMLNTSIIRMRSKEPTRCSMQYLWHYLRSKHFLDQVTRESQGSAQANFGPSHLDKAMIILPPLKEQLKIASRLSAIDAAIEKTKAVIDQTKRLKQGLLQELLTRGIGHTKFKQTEIGEIPEGWSVDSLESICSGGKGLQTGPFGSQLHASDYVNAGVPVVMPRDIKNLNIDGENAAKVSQDLADSLSKHKLQYGDLVFSRRGDIGRCGIVRKENVGWLCGTGCLRARADSQINPFYLLYAVASQRAQSWLNEHAVGQTMLNLNSSILGDLQIPIPRRQEQDKIVKLLTGIDNHLTSNSFVNLESIKAAVSRDLLSGDVRCIP